MKPAVTVALLIYKSPTWLEWCLRNLAATIDRANTQVLVVGNDANSRVTEWVKAHTNDYDDDEYPVCLLGRSDFGPPLFFRYHDYRNRDPHEYAMARVYRAWNHAVAVASHEAVVLVNSDMAFADHWLDELVALKATNPKCLPTSLLVESGRLVSGLPDHVKNCGTTPATFDRAAFLAHAELIRKPGASFSGGLFQPVLFNRQQFLDIGGYPIQEKNHVLASDAVLFNAMAAKYGLEHRTAMGSVVYHCQEGETRDE